jgi:phospholipase C
VARSSPGKAALTRRLSVSAPDWIQRIIMLTHENRTFDHPPTYSGVEGLEGGETVKTNTEAINRRAP